MFPNFWQGECSGDARRRAWKRSGLCQTLNATVSKVDNLVWLPCARKRENWSMGPTVDDFCAGTHGCRPKSRGPTDDPRGPRDDLRPLWLDGYPSFVGSWTHLHAQWRASVGHRHTRRAGAGFARWVSITEHHTSLYSSRGLCDLGSSPVPDIGLSPALHVTS